MREFPNNISTKEMGVDNQPKTSQLYNNALAVAENLQAIRDHYTTKKTQCRINVHVGYRSEEHNKKVGGVATSQHLEAAAADFSTFGTVPLQNIFNDIKNGVVKLPHTLSQLILEESKINKGAWGWLHLAVVTDAWAKARYASGKNNKPNQFMVKRVDKKEYDTVTADVA